MDPIYKSYINESREKYPNEPIIGEFMFMVDSKTKAILQKLKSKFKDLAEWSYYDNSKKDIIIVQCTHDSFKAVKKFLEGEGVEDMQQYLYKDKVPLGHFVTLKKVTHPFEKGYVGKFTWDFPGKVLPRKWHSIY